MIEIIIVFVLKLIDNILATVKTIYIHKEKYFLSAMFNALSTFFYLVAIVQISKSSNLLSIVSMCIATFIGTYLPGAVMKRSEGDKLFIFDVTACNAELGKTFADNVRELGIPIKTYSTYNNDIEKTLTCKIYCATKEDSQKILDIMPQTFEYFIHIPLQN